MLRVHWITNPGVVNSKLLGSSIPRILSKLVVNVNEFAAYGNFKMPNCSRFNVGSGHLVDQDKIFSENYQPLKG